MILQTPSSPLNSMHEFNQSLKYDKRMYRADVKGSIAYSKALQKVGIVSEEETKEIERGLKLVEKEWEEGKVSLIKVCAVELMDSSKSSPTMRISIPPTSVVFPKSSEQLSEESSTLVVPVTIKSQLTCASGLFVCPS
jgi:hypothetical protein